MATTPPFGLILPSRAVLANPAVVSPTQYAFAFHSTPSFTHIVIFLLPGTTLPDGSLAGVYLQLPGASQFKLLGAIGTEKPSAIFRVSGSRETVSGGNGSVEDEMTDDDQTLTTSNGTAATGEVTVGISIEPAVSITSQLEALKATQASSSIPLVLAKGQQKPTPLSTKVLAQRIIQNAFNFLASFAGNTGQGGQEVVPLKIFQDWWSKFERRIASDPTFLERDVDG